VFSGRQVYVYGTAGEPSDAEIERRRQEAVEATDWSWMGVRHSSGARVVADEHLTETEMAGANLILFGTRETNRLIARFARLLPMDLNAGAADFGLLQLVAEGGRYILVSSGKPWWADPEARERSRYLPEKLGLLQGSGDYLLFRQSLRNVIAEGRMDRLWKLPQADIPKLRDSGAVTIR
jgi:hypothetical protein